MNKPYLLLLGLSVITGCHSPDFQKESAWNRNYEAEQVRIEKEVSELRERDKNAKTIFLERYGRYQCTQEDVPKMEESKGPGHRFKSMQLGDHLTLKLRLGKAIYSNGSPYGPTRTESRYQLYWDNKLAAEAESLFSAANEGSAENRIFFNPESQTVVVFDDLCWSTERFLVFEKFIKPGKAPEWTTKYFGVPDTPSAEPFPDMGQILGVGNGCIYMEINGQPYAFPFDDFLVTKLEFTVG
ncbi:hypothetical protein [Prosthecobacter sp.]|uniref:hypothetical protein n=1 Tax=Prosthecobacter sp. TaxID=1965333 RepID=UPI002488A51A|nr:hypothetical protein [Prosthecobacter sp.]MDI1313729.1 hypothetical protein [Prosthecobacter sp.]